VPQCLVIAPSYADLSALRAVLTELGITATTTTRLLAGAQLATVPLDEFSFAVAVLSASGPDQTPSAVPATIFLEAGIALGRGLPLIVLAESPDEDLPALGGLASNVWTITGAKDQTSLQLHLTLFTKVLESTRASGLRLESPTALTVTPSFTPIGTGLELPTALTVTPSFESIGRHGQSLQEEVISLLEAGGAKVEWETGDDRIDTAALIPGTERVLGPVVIEVKSLQGHGLPQAVKQFAVFLARSRAMFGLVVYDGPRQEAGAPRGFPIMALHLDELRERVRDGSLGSSLVRIRNAAVHGIRDDV
jgi:hypothetical protein